MSQYGLGLGYTANLLQQYNIPESSLQTKGIIGKLAKGFAKIQSSGLLSTFSNLSNQVNMFNNMSSPMSFLMNPVCNNIVPTGAFNFGAMSNSGILGNSSSLFGNSSSSLFGNTSSLFGNNSAISNILGTGNKLFSGISKFKGQALKSVFGVGKNLLGKLAQTGIGKAVTGIGGKLIGKIAGSALGKVAGAVGGKLLSGAALALNLIPGIGTIASVALTLLGGPILKGIGKIAKGIGKLLKKL